MAASAQECEELIAIAREKGLVLMIGHTFPILPPSGRSRRLWTKATLAKFRYICKPAGLNLGLFQKDINVAVWDLAPHDISIIRNTSWANSRSPSTARAALT